MPSELSLYSKTVNLVGVNHKTLPIEGREVFSKLVENDPAQFLKAIAHDCALQEAALVSTCNRFEILSVGDDSENRVMSFLCTNVKGQISPEHFYAHRNTAAVKHLFRVASSLDSMVLGESQVFKQVKDSYELSVQNGFAGKHLHHLFQSAFHVAKQVRCDTEIGSHGISLSYVALRLAEQIFGDLKRCSVLIIGSGEMAELAALHFKTRGVSKLVVANRTLSNALEVARLVGASAISLDEIQSALLEVDVVIGSIRADQPLLVKETLSNLKRRRELFLIDLGVPRNFAADLVELEGVYLYNIDDLGAISERNRELRLEAQKDAELVIQHGLLQFERWLMRLAEEPRILRLRADVQRICDEEVREVLQRFGITGGVDALSASLSHRLTQKISHEVIATVEEQGAKRLKDGR